MTESILQVKGIQKRFPGVHALKGVDFEVRPGEIHALLGENGAGKSTLIKIIAGVHQPDSGEIYMNGKPVTFANPREAQKAGVATMYQELSLYPELTVAENIFMGHAPRRNFGDEADEWPTAWLCRSCHERWHAKMGQPIGGPPSRLARGDAA